MESTGAMYEIVGRMDNVPRMKVNVLQMKVNVPRTSHSGHRALFYQCQFSKCRVNYPRGRGGARGPHVTKCKKCNKVYVTMCNDECNDV